MGNNGIKIVDIDGLTRYHENLKGVLETKQNSISDLDTIRSGSAAGAVAEQNAKNYADGLSSNYDAAGAAATAEQNAKAYVDAISHASDVKYENGYINLYDANDNKIGDGFDASPFLVYGMLESVGFVDDSDSDSDSINTTLRFTFNTGNTGTDKTQIDVDFSEYVDVYHADESSIELDSATNTFSVKKVDATKTKTVDKIPVAGGPLAKLFENAGINVSDIAAGSSIESILMGLLFEELWPEHIETIDASLTSSCAEPTVTLNGMTNGNTSTVEVGTSVSYSVTSGESGYTSIPHTVKNLEYGYANADDGHLDSTDKIKRASFGTISAVASSVPKLTLSGLVDGIFEGTKGSSAANAVTKSGNVVIEEGTKELKAFGTSIEFTGTCSALDVVFGCSNSGKTNNNGTTYESTAKNEVTLTSAAVNSDEVTVTCVGKYKYFLGYSDNTRYDQFESSTIRALTTKSNFITVDGTTTIVGSSSIKSNGKSIVIACPNKYKLNTIQNGVGADILGNFKSTGNVTVTTGTTSTTYKVYVYPITNGTPVEFKNVTLSKA